MKTISQDLLAEVTKRLAAEFQPEQVWLFGSHAWGEPDEGSDLDLLVVVPQGDETPVRRAQRAHRSLKSIPVAMGHPGEDARGSGTFPQCESFIGITHPSAWPLDLWMTPSVTLSARGSPRRATTSILLARFPLCQMASRRGDLSRLAGIDSNDLGFRRHVFHLNGRGSDVNTVCNCISPSGRVHGIRTERRGI